MGDQALTMEQVEEWFNSNGWKEWKVSSIDSHDRQWFKKIPDVPRCAGNDDKDLQVRARLWDNRKYPYGAIGIQVDITAEPARDSGWVKLEAYAFDGLDGIDKQIERLLVAWKAVVGASV